MALKHRVNRLEQVTYTGKILLVHYGSDPEPARCACGEQTQVIPPDFKGEIIHLVYPEDWRQFGEARGCPHLSEANNGVEASNQAHRETANLDPPHLTPKI